MTAHTPRTVHFADFLDVLHAARRQILIGAGIGALCAFILILTAVPATRATMLIAPADRLSDSNQNTPNDKNMAILRLLANASGTSSSANFEQFISTYAGVHTARALLKDPHINAGLQADQRFMFTPATRHWPPERLSAYIKHHVKISALGGTSIKKLEYWHPNPAFGLYFLTQLHDITDKHIRQDRQDSAAQRSAYLKKQLNQTHQIEHKRILSDLLLEEERMLMFSAIDQPFAATIIEPPSHFYKPEWPMRAVLLFLLTGGGALFGYILFTLRKHT